MNSASFVDFCPNCGAPFQLDATGACQWCHAHIRTEQALFTGLDFRDTASLVPDDADDCMSSAPFLFLTLSTLGPLLSTEPVVQRYMDQNPRLLQQIRTMSTAVSAAGVRVRNAGLLKDDFDDNLHVYAPEEIWTFNLAFDVIALIGTLDGLPGRVRAKAASDLRSLHETAHGHTWNSAMKKAGEGPMPFRELRAQVPHRT